MVYLDYNATTPLLPEVRAAMEPYFAGTWGNPSSSHLFGLHATQAINQARIQVASLIAAEASQIVFTGSATEANNTALNAALASPGKRRRIITTATEHSSVLTFCSAMARSGIEVKVLPVLASGIIDMSALQATLTPETAVVSVMWANNETGVINPIEIIAQLCAERGVLFHCDAVQAAGRLPIDFSSMQVDYLTFSGHKIYGPKGVGALALGHGASFTPLLYGGQQENGKRGGTENVPAIVGFGKATEMASQEQVSRNERVLRLRDELEGRILAEIYGTYLNGNQAPRVPNTSNIGFSGIDSETLVSVLDQEGVCVSSGSACLSDSVTPSHVIHAMTGSYQKADEGVRFSLSHLNTSEEIDMVIQILKAKLHGLRERTTH